MALPEQLGINPPPNPYKTTPEGLDEGILQTAPLERGREATTSGALEDTVRPTWAENLFLQMDENFRQTGLGLPGSDLQGPLAYEIAEALANLGSEGRTKLSAEEANKLYPGMPTPFTGEILPEVAQIRYENVQKARRVNEWMSRGPSLGFGSQLLAGIPTAIEPITAAITFASGGLLGKFVPKAGFLTHVGVNVGENLALDIPSNLSQQRRQQETLSLGETVAGSIGGGVAGTALFKSIDFAGRKFFPSDEIKSSAVREAIAQAENNRVIKSQLADENIQALKSGKIEGAPTSNYTFTPFKNVPDRVFYSGLRAVDDAPVSSDLNFGRGLLVIDDPNVARNLTGSADEAFTGSVRELQIPSPDKLLDLDNSIDAPEASIVKNFINEKFGKDVPPEIKTVKQALEYLNNKIDSEDLPESVLTDLSKKLESEGVEGYRFIESRPDGTSDNRAVIFDEGKTKILNESPVNRGEIPRVTDSAREKSQNYLAAPEASRYYDPDQSKILSEMSTKDIESVLKEYETKDVVEQYTNAERMLSEKAKTDPELKAELDEVNDKLKVDAKEVSLIKQMADCVLGSLI